MPKPPLSAGSFLASLSHDERDMLTSVQDKLRAQRSLGHGPQGTIELPLQWCEEAVDMHRKGQVTRMGLQAALEWALVHPDQVQSMSDVVQLQGVRLMHDKGTPQQDLNNLAHAHAQWRLAFAANPEKAMRDMTRTLLMVGRGKSNPREIEQVVQNFFAQQAPTSTPTLL